ncbi:MAG: thioredoxin-disulfide reductase [Alphaproteobacteria bacterium]|nr:thioredoxin-disulfide reductase [Alphaproteobacteria bacterium]
MNRHHEVVIIGSGPAGYSAGIYAARNGNKPLIITGMEFGGQITKSFDLENYPGFTEKIDGLYLTEQMRKQAEIFGAEILADTVVEADLKNRPFTLKTENGDVVTADAVIIATGASCRTLGLSNEKALTGHGVSYCATCDGFFFRDKEVFVVGGGNTAVYEALHLSTVCKKVTVIHRRDHFTAENINQKHFFDMSNCSVIWNSTLEEIVEKDGKVSAVKVKNVQTGDVTEYATEGVFIAIGNKPNTDIFAGQIKLDDAGYIQTKPNLCATEVEGVFAAGDVKNPHFKQVVIAAASGAQAAMEATEYLLSNK